MRRIDADLTNAYRAERRTLFLRTIWFPTAEFALRPPGRRRARLGRLARLERPRDDRRGDRGRALRRPARRPRRPADLVARRDPGRRDVVRAPRRDRAASRPTATATDETPDDERLRAAGRALRVRRGPRRAARDRPRPRAGRARRGRRAVRRRQVDARAPARRDPPAARRPRRRRRRAARRPAARDAAQGGRARHAGAARLRRHARREPEARAPGRERRPSCAAALAAVDALDWVGRAAGGLETRSSAPAAIR